MKQKRRYIAFQADTETKVDARTAQDAINKAHEKLYGTIGTAKIDPYIVPQRWDTRNKQGLLRVERAYVDEAICSLASVNDIKGSKAVIRTLLTSGTIKKAMRAFS